MASSFHFFGFPFWFCIHSEKALLADNWWPSDWGPGPDLITKFPLQGLLAGSLVGILIYSGRHSIETFLSVCGSCQIYDLSRFWFNFPGQALETCEQLGQSTRCEKREKKMLYIILYMKKVQFNMVLTPWQSKNVLVPWVLSARCPLCRSVLKDLGQMCLMAWW